jgi:hypothetical protein
VQDLPVETEAAKAEAHAEGAPSPSVSPATARGYYKQLHDAGGLSSYVGSTTQGFVCFNDDPNSQIFLTFLAGAYSAKYAKAVKVLGKTPPAQDPEIENAVKTVTSVQASAPYVNFLDDETIARMKPEVQTKFQPEGGVMVAAFYQKGVMTGSHEYRWDWENSWVVEENLDSGRVKSTLFIEPTTLRYTWILKTVGGDSSSESGMCEKIPIKQSN